MQLLAALRFGWKVKGKNLPFLDIKSHLEKDVFYVWERWEVTFSDCWKGDFKKMFPSLLKALWVDSNTKKGLFECDSFTFEFGWQMKCE